MDWVNWNAAAPSGGTGPDAASAGSYYLYTEASLNGATNAVVDGNPQKRAYLEATFDFTGEFDVSYPIARVWVHIPMLQRHAQHKILFQFVRPINNLVDVPPRP